jgi:hypothetical protein
MKEQRRGPNRGAKPQRRPDSGGAKFLPRLGGFFVGVVLLAAAMLIIDSSLLAGLALGTAGVIVLITSD